jgi:hypothetical protein
LKSQRIDSFLNDSLSVCFGFVGDVTRFNATSDGMKCDVER